MNPDFLNDGNNFDDLPKMNNEANDLSELNKDEELLPNQSETMLEESVKEEIEDKKEAVFEPELVTDNIEENISESVLEFENSSEAKENTIEEVLNEIDLDLNKPEKIESDPLPGIEEIKDIQLDPLPEIEKKETNAVNETDNVFGFDLSEEPIKEIKEDETPELKQEETKGKNNNFISLVIAIVIIVIVILGTLKLLMIGKKGVPEVPDSNSSVKTPVVEPSKPKDEKDDSLIYTDQIINDVNSQILLFKQNRDYVYLYIGAEGKLMVTLGKQKTITNDETKGYVIGRLSQKQIKTLYQSEGCELTDTNVYVLTVDGELFNLDMKIDFTEMYNNLKVATPESKFDLNLTQVFSDKQVLNFTNIVERKTECQIINPYVLINNNPKTINRIELRNENLMITERYQGHVNAIGENQTDYLIYADKLMSDSKGTFMKDINNQNHKIEKIIYGQGQIEKIKSAYIFITTDNKLMYSNQDNLLNLKTNDKIVKEIIEITKENEDGTIKNKAVKVIYSDDTEEEFYIENKDLNIIETQTLIDNN